MHPLARKKLMQAQHFSLPPEISDTQLALLYDPLKEDGVGLSRRVTSPNIVEISRQYLKERRDMLKGMAYYLWNLWNQGRYSIQGLEGMAQSSPCRISK